MSKLSKLGKNFGLLTLGSFASSLLSFLFVPLYTALLTTEEYGSIDLISVTISLSYPILTLVISEAVMRFCLDKENDASQIFSIGFYITTCGCLGMLVLSIILFITPLKDYYWCFILHFIFQAFYAMVAQYVKGQENVKAYAIGGLLNSATVIACNLLFLLVLKIGVYGYLLSLILGHAVATVYYLLTIRAWKYIVPLKKLNRCLLTSMLVYSYPMILNSISWWISNSSDKYILSFFCGLSENGIYAVAYKIPSVLSIITGLFISAWQISAVEDFNTEASIKFFSNVGSKYAALNVLISGWLIAFSRMLADFLFSADYFVAWRISPILIVAYAFNTMSSFYGTIYTASKKTKMLLYSTLAAAFTNIILNIILIPHFGGIGAAVATMASYCLILLIRVFDSRKIMNLQLPWRKIIMGAAILLTEIILVNMNSLQGDLLCIAGAAIITVLNVDIIKEIIFIVLNKLGLRRSM